MKPRMVLCCCDAAGAAEPHWARTSPTVEGTNERDGTKGQQSFKWPKPEAKACAASRCFHALTNAPKCRSRHELGGGGVASLEVVFGRGLLDCTIFGQGCGPFSIGS